MAVRHRVGLLIAFSIVASSVSTPVAAEEAAVKTNTRIATIPVGGSPLGIAAATDQGSPGAGGTHLDLAGARVIDLSHAYGPETLFWPANPPQTFQLEVLSHGLTPGGVQSSTNDAV